MRLQTPPAAVDSRPLADPYAALVLEQAPRVLSLMDRERFSRTTGCMDRTYWAWKFVDFPGSRFQEGVCTLAYLYATPLPESLYHRSSALLEWIAGGLRFWTTLQHRDGSFDEAYPFERSLAATAFTSFYVAEALELVGSDLPPDVLESTNHTLARAGRWLGTNDESHGFLSNHLAAAAAALHHVYRVTGDGAHARRSQYFVDRILQRQSAEGWYDEYGGADPGYQTHGTFYLARLWQLTGDERLASSLERSTAFLAHFVHPDGSVGGEYASRNTQTYYPAAFEMLAARDSSAAWIADTMRPHVETAAAAGLRSIDIYNYFPMLNNLHFAQRARSEGRTPVAPVEPSAESPMVWFPGAGIVRYRRPAYDAFIGTAKGGVVKVFDRRSGRLVCSDCGYIGHLESGQVASTQYFDPQRSTVAEPGMVQVEGGVMAISRPTMDPVRFAGFRLFTLSIGRLGHAGRWLKRLLVRVLIYRRSALDARFRRTVTCDDDRVIVADELSGAGLLRFKHMERGAVFTTIHMGSSRYFVENELLAHVADNEAARVPVGTREAAAGLHLTRIVTLD